MTNHTPNMLGDSSNFSNSTGNFGHFDSDTNTTLKRTEEAFTLLAAWFGVRISLATIGTTLNGSILFLVCRTKRLRLGVQERSSIANLVATDLVSCLVHIPLNSALPVAQSLGHPIAAGVCTVTQCAYATTLMAANWTYTCLAINRFVAVCHPYSYAPMTSNRATFGMVVFCWAVSLVIQVQIALGIGGQFALSPVGQCFQKRRPGALAEFYTSVFTYIPYTITAVCCACICRSMVALNLRRVAPLQTSRVQQVSMRHRVTVARMLMVSCLWYFLCSVPVPIMGSISPKLLSDNQSVNLWLRLPLVIRTALNPVNISRSCVIRSLGLNDFFGRAKTTCSSAGHILYHGLGVP